MRCEILGAGPSWPRLQMDSAPIPQPGWPGDEFRPGPEGSEPPRTAAAPRPVPGPREREALDKEKEQQDRLLAEQIYARMRADRALVQARLAAMAQDLQTEIFRIFQEVLIRRRKVHDAILASWHKVLLG